jgi:cellulose synthase/poly-beta-1,6-N-acetylglucosamine synthase-like glycosyltransferase
MFATILTYITLIAGFLYFLLAVMYSWSFSHLKSKRSFKKRLVSVIIASRNEENTLPRLLTLLVNQTYPNDLYEVIIANDGSDDRSEEILQSFAQRYTFIKYFNVENRELAISPKKNALSQAIARSHGEILLLTDADCFPKSTWIESMVQAFTDDVSMVAGYSATEIDWKKASFVQKFEHIDLLCLYIGLAGGFALGKQFTAIGQNLAYTRQAYDRVGGFSKINHLISGDDCNFLQLLRKEGMKIRFNFAEDSFVKTKAITSWKKLFNQHSRWFSNLKLMLKMNTEFFLILAGLFIFYVGIVLHLFIDWRVFTIALSLKFVGELQMFYFAYPIFKSNRRLIFFYPVWMVIQTIFNILTIFFGQFNWFVWHGKKQKIAKRNSNEVLDSR